MRNEDFTEGVKVVFNMKAKSSKQIGKVGRAYKSSRVPWGTTSEDSVVEVRFEDGSYSVDVFLYRLDPFSVQLELFQE